MCWSKKIWLDIASYGTDMGKCNCLFVPLIHRFDCLCKRWMRRAVASSPSLSLHEYVAWGKKLVKWWCMSHLGETTWLDVAAQAFHFLTPWKHNNIIMWNDRCIVWLYKPVYCQVSHLRPRWVSLREGWARFYRQDIFLLSSPLAVGHWWAAGWPVSELIR